MVRLSLPELAIAKIADGFPGPPLALAFGFHVNTCGFLVRLPVLKNQQIAARS
tara:strand:+ start:302 stop:460 length:159 start_codon:yes stop_codon:yes gene_type:complete